MAYDKEKFADEINAITSSLSALLQRKNADYGNNVDKGIDKRGLGSLVQRLEDKLARFENLAEKGNVQQVSDEAIEDTLLDIAGYAILGYRKIQEMNKGVAVFDAIGMETGQALPRPKIDIDRKPMSKILVPQGAKKTFTFNE